MTVDRAIDAADSLLPGTPTPFHNTDPRWQAIIAVAEYIDSNPDEIWQFVHKWGGHPQEDLRNAIACCLLEHMLDYHFESIFPRVRSAVNANRLFADMFCRCWKFGQSDTPDNSQQFDKLKDWCREHWGV